MNDDLKQRLYIIADRMRNMATIGKHFADNVYEQERLDTMLALAVEVAALADEEYTPDEIRAHFWAEPWHRLSPAIGVDAFVLNSHHEILLIQRADNQHWAMPGGLSEVGYTTAETAVKELWEEAGLRGEAKRLLGIFDNRIWGTRSKLHLMNMVYLVECEELHPSIGVECLDCGFFAADALPAPLHPGHDTRIPACFRALDGNTYFDPAAADTIDLSNHQQQ